MSYDWNEIQTLLSDIQEYSEIDGPTSHTEAIECMCGVLARPDYVDEDTVAAVMKDLKLKLKYYRDHAIIVKREETVIHTVIDLDWIN